MTPTRADLERRIETWRKEAKQLRAMAEAELHNLDFRDEWDNRARELDRCADELAALLTSEGPAQRPETPTVGTCATCRHWSPEDREAHIRAHCLMGVSGSSQEKASHHPYPITRRDFGCTLYDPMPLPDAPKEPT